ncbi:MAG: flagellar basal body-associated FliL family protein [Chromatiales bacterium]|nr:flagellar basal body-associated FliL family protein [Chromatiales bacterium]
MNADKKADCGLYQKWTVNMRFLSQLLIAMALCFAGSVMAADDEEEEEKKVIGYHEMNPSLVVNIQGRGKYMRCDVQLMTKDEINLPDIQTHAPALRHELLMLFGDQKGEELKSPKGKEKLRVAALKALQKVMEEISGDKKIDDLYFTAFFVQ